MAAANPYRKTGNGNSGRKGGNQEVTFDFDNVAPLSLGDDPYSDTEAIRQYRHAAYQGGVQMTALTDGMHRRRLAHESSGYTDDLTDDDQAGDPQNMSLDEFGENAAHMASKLVRTGRQRKKLASRTKGGEFQARRKKRRLYFGCVSSEIDVHKLHDYFVGAGGTMNGWKFQVTGDVLHLYRGGAEVPTPRNSSMTGPAADEFEGQSNSRFAQASGGGFDGETGFGEPDPYRQVNFSSSNSYRDPSKRRASDEILPDATLGKFDGQLGVSAKNSNRQESDELYLRQSSSEVFVFEFGAVVFWGFPRGEEINFLKIIRMFVTKGYVGPEEFQDGVDDMAFVSLPDTDAIAIANDVLNIPEDAPTKQRLAVSFAIAQSTILAIFESRVYKLIEDYKYIPEALAAYGKIHLSGRQLGKMIGDVFVIRHDVNLHTEILDIPDFFWKDGEKYADDYLLVSEM
jgi:uncharacterized Rmd1/YagE family protein